MKLCAITDRKQTGQPLLNLVEGWSAGGVHLIQLREKDLDAIELQALAREVLAKIDRSRTKLLINVSTPESAVIALEAGADGVHLSGRPRPGAVSRVRQLFRPSVPIVSVPCHSLQDIDRASQEQVDLMLFSPVFEKLSSPPQGLEGLRLACAAASGIPVFALGGVTAANASDCVAVGAAGIAGIRLFAGDDWLQLLRAGENHI
jgi:thiamine-phosphate pyrophosphorylase